MAKDILCSNTPSACHAAVTSEVTRKQDGRYCDHHCALHSEIKDGLLPGSKERGSCSNERLLVSLFSKDGSHRMGRCEPSNSRGRGRLFPIGRSRARRADESKAVRVRLFLRHDCHGNRPAKSRVNTAFSDQPCLRDTGILANEQTNA